MDWVLLLWLPIIGFIVFSSRMKAYHFREAVFWKVQLDVLEVIVGVGEHHDDPAAREAFNCLLGHLKTNGDLHIMEEKSRSTWERFKMGGRM